MEESNQTKNPDNLPTVNAWVIGAKGAGKTSLISALSAQFGGISGGRSPSSTSEPSIPTLEFNSTSFHYTLFDFPSTSTKLDIRASGILMEAAILVWSVADDSSPEARDQLKLAKAANARSVSVFLNKSDLLDDRELIELQTMEIDEALADAGFEPKDAKYVTGSATAAGASDAIQKLVVAIDDAVARAR